jgi:DnaJ-class molecular chaperone
MIKRPPVDPLEDKCKCPGCSGTGVQKNTLTGLRVLCPICGGSGKRKNKPRLFPRKVYMQAGNMHGSTGTNAVAKKYRL